MKLFTIILILIIACQEPEIKGCLDSGACNYNPDATFNKGCIYPVGCNNWCEGDIDSLLEYDNCGICGGDNSTCDDSSNGQVFGCMAESACNYNPDATIVDDSCDYSCHPINSLWFVPNSDGTWGIGYYSNIEIVGFQFDVIGASINSASGGEASANGFMVSAGNTTVIGFSLSGSTLPVGGHILTILDLSTIPSGLNEIIISNASGGFVDFTFDATYFSFNLNTTGNSKLTIFSSSISTLEVGDEIGIFDSNGILNYNDCSNQIGELLVGSSVWQGEQLNIVSIGSVDYCDIGEVQLSGFQLSNPIIIKIWDVSEQTLKIAAPEYSSGSGLFSDVLTVISELSF